MIAPDVTAADRFIMLGYGLIIIMNEGEYMVLSVYKIYFNLSLQIKLVVCLIGAQLLTDVQLSVSTFTCTV